MVMIMQSFSVFVLLIRSQSSYGWISPTGPFISFPTASRRSRIRHWSLNVSPVSSEEPSTVSATQQVVGVSSWFNVTNTSKDDVTSITSKLGSSSFQHSMQQKSLKAPTVAKNTSLVEINKETLFASAAILAAMVALFNSPHIPSLSSLHLPAVVEKTMEVLANPVAALDRAVEVVDSMGPLGIVYFGIAYTLAEVLAIPAVPLTASAGYLFGVPQGTAVVLLSASVAAVISFSIGRTLLRDYVEGVLKDYPKFAKMDRAIGKEGFKLMLLLRLSPVFPFALSNYLYGASSINFWAFFWATLLGFAPGTIAYVYTGYVGKALSGGGGADAYPWYVYAGGLTVLASLLKLLADTATRIVEEIEAEEDE